ncbi:hypothetical protein [Acinetobacter sp. WZC-1]|uniref:hypothetical protein n=1 Tax=Acinetobacter sp. WZC-1 TaxID=3459034 RepID=UPI00403D97F1
MDDKKIYQLLQHWFPALKARKIPKKKHRRDYEMFLEWLYNEKMDDPHSGYLMHIDQQQYVANGLRSCAVLQQHAVNIEKIQQHVEQRVTPLFSHYEKYQQVIGKYYSLQCQVYDIVMEEIFNAVKSVGHEMLLIHAAEYYWMAIPEDDVKIEKFCRLFEKQFKDYGIRIEHYQLYECSRST